MNLLLNSNGVHKIKREKLSTMKLCKRCLICFFALIILGFVIQIVINFVDNAGMKSRFKYVRIDGKKIEYKIKGNGAYTVVMDGSIGATMYEWNDTCKKLEENRDITTFIYNRQGYGFNDIGDLKTPEEQAKDLKLLLKKVGAPAPYILIGKEYGSLITTNFVKLYPDLVQGVILANPILEENLNTEESKKSIQSKHYRSKIEAIGSNFTLTSLLNKIGLTIENYQFKEQIDDNELEEFNSLKNKKNYKYAVANEIQNLYNNTSDSQDYGILENKPLYIISKNDDDSIKKIGTSEFTTIYKQKTDDEEKTISDSELIVNGTNNVIKDIKKINKHS